MKFLMAGDSVSNTDTECDARRGRCSTCATPAERGRATPVRRGASLCPDGQTLVEFAFILPLFLLLMLGVIQMVLIGGAALAVNQAAVSCSRYAALNPTYNATQINSYLTTVASPLINDSGLKPITVTPSSVPRPTGSAVSVTVTYDLKTKLILGKSFFGVTFPTQISVTHTVTSE
ncbi:MAG TPA: TadE/TadG family type IV pilus assembly protein [Candidatus Binataceae bacterium]|nr:TadE/TadG family type IV pilus assembly protein [Candidatus Binataceae bacterium]